jgi:hypothetical protein
MAPSAMSRILGQAAHEGGDAISVFDWLKRHRDFCGAVYFADRLLPPPEHFLARFERTSFRIDRKSPGPEESWRVELRHPQWGTADLAARREPTAPPNLTESESRRPGAAGFWY